MFDHMLYPRDSPPPRPPPRPPRQRGRRAAAPTDKHFPVEKRSLFESMLAIEGRAA